MPNASGDRVLDERGIPDRGQSDEPHPIGECLSRLADDLHRQPRFPHPAGARQRHQRNVLARQQVAQRSDFFLAADDRGAMPRGAA